MPFNQISKKCAGLCPKNGVEAGRAVSETHCLVP